MSSKSCLFARIQRKKREEKASESLWTGLQSKQLLSCERICINEKYESEKQIKRDEEDAEKKLLPTRKS